MHTIPFHTTSIKRHNKHAGKVLNWEIQISPYLAVILLLPFAFSVPSSFLPH